MTLTRATRTNGTGVVTETGVFSRGQLAFTENRTEAGRGKPLLWSTEEDYINGRSPSTVDGTISARGGRRDNGRTGVC